MTTIPGTRYCPYGGTQPVAITYTPRTITAIQPVITPAPAPVYTPSPTPVPQQVQQSSPIPTQIPQPAAGSPFVRYEVQQGYYYGVYPSGGMTRLNPVTGGRPNDSLAAYNQNRPTTPVLQQLPDRPPLGSTKEAIRAWSESYASVARANALAMGQTPVSEQLLANSLFNQSIQLNSPKFLALEAQYKANQYKTSQGLFGSGAPIPTLFTPSTAFGGDAGAGFGGGEVGGRDQSIFSKQYQPSEVTIPFTNISVYPAYEALHGAGDWFTKNIGDRVGSGVIATPFNAPTALLSMAFPKNQAIQTMAKPANDFTTGLILKAPVATLEFIGMVPVGAAILAKEPAVFPAAAAAGLMLQARGIKEGITTRPGEFLGEQAGVALITMGMGKGIKAISPVKYTGPVQFGKGSSLANYRGVYLESPVSSISRLLVRASEFEGTRNIFGVTTNPKSPAFLKDFRTSIGTPSHFATPRYLGEGFVPGAGRTVVDVPVLGKYLKRYGEPGAFAEYQTKLNLLSESYKIRPTQVKNPYAAIEEVSVIKRGTGKQFLDLVKEAAPEHKFTGSFEQIVFQKKAPAAHDVDILVPEKDIARVQRTMADRYFAKQYGPQNVRTSDKSGGIQIFKEGKWETAMDIHSLEEHTGVLGYGVRTGVPVEVEGLKFIPWKEQMQRKIVSAGALRKTPEGWTTAPEFWRGKDVADILGGLETRMLEYTERGAHPPKRLVTTYEQIRQTIEPGAPLSKVYNVKTGKSVAREAQLRLGGYWIDTTPKQYTKIPFMNKYVDFGKYTPFETRYLNPYFERYGIGMGTRIIDPGAMMEYPKAIRVSEAGGLFAGAVPEMRVYPTTMPITPRSLGYGGFATTGGSRTPMSFGYSPASQQSPQNYFGSGGSGGYRAAAPSYITSTTRTPKYAPGRQTTPRTPQIVTHPRRTPSSPGKYITTTTKTPKYPPGIPPEKPPKYPPSLPPQERPPTYPPGKPPSTPPGYPPSKPPKYPPGIPPEKPPTYPPNIPPFPPTTPPTTPPGIPPYSPPETPPTIFTPPHQFLLVEEWPPKTPKLRLHFDVIGSKWNIRNPIPRLGTGAYPKIELKIEDKVYSRDPMRYVEHRPYNKFVSWRTGSSWNVKNPVPRIRGGKYPKRELQVSNVNKGRFVSMTPAAVSKKGKVSVI